MIGPLPPQDAKRDPAEAGKRPQSPAGGELLAGGSNGVIYVGSGDDKVYAFKS